LWDVVTRQQIGSPLLFGNDYVDSVAFSPDGKTVPAGDGSGTARLWDVSYLVDPARWLCAQVGRSFTPAQWAQQVPGPAYRQVCP
jgi:WD40 repeat protein